MVARIFIAKDIYALVDDEDAGRVSAYDWTLVEGHKTHYARTSSPRVGKNCQLLHRFVLLAPPRTAVDHADGDGLNNRRSNLRLATNSQNQQNKFVSAIEGKTSIFKGVCRSGAKWLAQISLDGTKQNLGLFDSDYEAARAYDAAAIRLFGEFARTNEMMGLFAGAKADGPRHVQHIEGVAMPAPWQVPAPKQEPWERVIKEKPLHVKRLYRMRARQRRTQQRQSQLRAAGLLPTQFRQGHTQRG